MGIANCHLTLLFGYSTYSLNLRIFFGN